MTTDSHIIFLYGNDEYAIARRVGEFGSMFANKSETELNTARLDAATMTEDELNNAVNALPFLADHRLVFLSNPSKRYVGRKTKGRDRAPSEVQVEDQVGEETPADDHAPAEAQTEAREKFLEFLGRVPPTTKLVITEVIRLETKKDQAAAEKHWLVKWMKGRGLGLERFALPSAEEMRGWIARYVKEQRGEIAGTAAARLAELVGTDTRQAAQEIAKLLTYANWNRPITVADVEAVILSTAEPNIFEMVDAIAKGKIGEAQGLLHRLLEAQEAWSTWGMIVRQFRLLLLAREVLDGGGGEPEAITAVRGSYPNAGEYVARKALGQARGFTMLRLEAIYHKLLEIDEAAKTGHMPLDLGMDVLLAELPET